MRLVLLAATVHTTSAALALPSVLTTRGHNATAYVVAAAPGGCGPAPHLRVACGKPRRVFAEELPAAVLVTRCAFCKKPSCLWIGALARVQNKFSSCHTFVQHYTATLILPRNN